MKLVTWIVFVSLILISVFKYKGADLSNNVLALILMTLLLTLFSDLKEFNFWGLWGKRTEKEFKQLEDKQAISATKEDVSKRDIVEAEKNSQIQLMDNSKGNFLAIVFDMERLLRIYATVNLAKDIPSNSNSIKLTNELHTQGFLTDDGIKQIEAIRWLKDILINGRDQEINQATLDAGIQIAWKFYQEIYNWLYPPKQ